MHSFLSKHVMIRVQDGNVYHHRAYTTAEGGMYWHTKYEVGYVDSYLVLGRAVLASCLL